MVMLHIGGNAVSNWSLFSYIPTVLWWVNDDGDNIDQALDVIAWCGLSLSAVVMVMGSSNVIISSLLWLLYHSLVNVGQQWLVYHMVCNFRGSNFCGLGSLDDFVGLYFRGISTL